VGVILAGLAVTRRDRLEQEAHRVRTGEPRAVASRIILQVMEGARQVVVTQDRSTVPVVQVDHLVALELPEGLVGHLEVQVDPLGHPLTRLVDSILLAHLEVILDLEVLRLDIHLVLALLRTAIQVDPGILQVVLEALLSPALRAHLQALIQVVL